MTDDEIVQRCAEAMGIELFEGNTLIPADKLMDKSLIAKSAYNPLTDDAQAMALVKRFKLSLLWNEDGTQVLAAYPWAANTYSEYDASENRAICLCVAKMQAAK